MQARARGSREGRGPVALRAVEPARLRRRRTNSLRCSRAPIARRSCGKKGDPQPPLPQRSQRRQGPRGRAGGRRRGPDLHASPTGSRRARRSRISSRSRCTAWSIRPRASRRRPVRRRRPGRGGTSSAELRGLGSSERRAATNVRLAEEAFYRDSERVAALSLPAIADATRGASVVYRDSLVGLFLQEDGPHPLAYAVVSVRRGGERSPLSNIVSITPGIAPRAPELLPRHPRRGARLPRVDRAPAERALPAGRDRRLPRLSPAAVGGGVRARR